MSEEKVDNFERQAKNASADIVIDNKFFRWAENFWFYHKWHLLIAVALIFVLVTVIFQMTERDSDDIVILTAGPYKPSISQSHSISDAFETVLPYDLNGDGEKNVSAAHIEVYSKDQLIEFKNEYKAENGESPLINSSLNAENLKGFHNLIMAGEYSICIIDMWLYEDVKDAGGFRPLAEIFPDGIPTGAIDEYAVKFTETEFAKSFDCFKDLPESTVICLRTQGVMNSIFNKSSADEKYSQAIETFKAILNYKSIEE